MPAKNGLLSIIIPAFNEETRLPHTLRSLLEFLSDEMIESEIVVVDDGSTDGTVKVTKKTFQQFFSSRVTYCSLKVIKLNENCGKGFAVSRVIFQVY